MRRMLLAIAIVLFASAPLAQAQHPINGTVFPDVVKLTDSVLGGPVLLTWSDSREGWTGTGNGVTYYLERPVVIAPVNNNGAILLAIQLGLPTNLLPIESGILSMMLVDGVMVPERQGDWIVSYSTIAGYRPGFFEQLSSPFGSSVIRYSTRTYPGNGGAIWGDYKTVTMTITP